MKYGIKKDGKFVLIDDDLNRLKATLAFRPDLSVDDIKEYKDSEAKYPEPVLTAEEARAKRNALLAATDYLLMPDYPISESKLADVKEYRQKLRDITLNRNFPNDITWPVEPEL